MHRRILATTLILMLAAFATGGLATPAFAHEGRKVGNFEFTVGWLNEPAFAGFQNAVFVHIVDGTRDPHRPVTDLKDTLKVEVSFGDQKRTMTMEPDFVPGVFGEPGDYVAHVVPNRPGQYKFHFTGTIRGQKVDATFTSGPNTFDNVQNTTEAQFPAKDPSTGELATRLDREVPRLQTALTAATAAASRANDDADQAKLFGYAGIGLGVIALLIALTRGRRKST